MKGWFVCNGFAGTPNLLGDTFLRGGVSSGGFGGSNDAVVVQHTHRLNAIWSEAFGTTVFGYKATTTPAPIDNTIESAGVSGVGVNQPEYMNVIWIIRMS